MFAVDFIGRAAPHRTWSEVRHDLMAAKVEIHPLIGTPPFGATEKIAVKAAGRGKVVDRKGMVEGREAHPLDMSLRAQRSNPRTFWIASSLTPRNDVT
jgi:hypothetical protein